MQLAIDIGNTRIKWCVFDRQAVIRSGTLNELNDEQLRQLLKENKTANPVVSSVVDLSPDLLQTLQKNECFIISHKTSIPITNTYETPSTLGMDRLCCAIGASAVYPEKPVLVIDAGTCLKFEFIDSKKTYHGGTIGPGMQMRFTALNHYTSKLPLVNKEATTEILGKSTEEAIRIGVQQGMNLEIQAMIDQMKALHPNLKVIGTGGDITFFANALKTHIFADSLLVLRGINEIYLHNS